MPGKKATAASKKGRGRPSKFDGIDLNQVRQLATRGWTDAEMAKFFDIAESNWNEWKLKHPEFQESLKDWKIEADSKVERSLYERATGYSHPDVHISNFKGLITVTDIIKHYPPDSTAAIFWLKNRKPGEWKDKQEVQHSGHIIVDVPEED